MHVLSYTTTVRNLVRNTTQKRMPQYAISSLDSTQSRKKVQNSELFYEIAYYPEMRSMRRSLRMVGSIHKHCD